MERVIATYHLDAHRLDVVEFIDDDNVSIRLLVDGELLPPDVHLDREPTADEAASLLESWRDRAGSPPQIAYAGGLLPAEVIALLDALDDEYKAQATYARVIADFGEVLPFTNIIEAEGRHIDALVRLMHRYQVPVPPNPWTGDVPAFASLMDACTAAVQGEIDNGALYDRLVAATERPDILEVFRNLQEASQERHLPAFQRCVERGGTGGGGPGGRSGGGQGRGQGGGHRHRGGA